VAGPRELIYACESRWSSVVQVAAYTGGRLAAERGMLAFVVVVLLLLGDDAGWVRGQQTFDVEATVA
jgi:hypothetical protein